MPVFYALTLFRSKEQLGECRNLELSAYTEGKRIELGNRLTGRARRLYQPEIDEAEERKAELEVQYAAKRGDLPGKLKKLTNGYEMRTYWFEIFECTRKIMLVALPILLPADSPEQVVLGLIICFCTFGAYMMYSPFINDGDDLLSQICQMQIFFSLLSTIILQTNPNSPAMAAILPILIAFPPLMGFVFESGVLKELKKLSSPDDNGWPIPFTGGKRIGVGIRAKSIKFLERLLGVKKLEKQREDEEDKAAIRLQEHFREKRERHAMAMQIREAQLLKKLALLERQDPDDETDTSSVPTLVKTTFAHFDKDSTNSLDYKELRNALQALGLDTSHPTAASYIKKYDDQPDGSMQLSEFAELVSDLESGITRSENALLKTGKASGGEKPSGVSASEELAPRIPKGKTKLSVGADSPSGASTPVEDMTERIKGFFSPSANSRSPPRPSLDA